jgi:apolipoprotein N-acyltransferase
LGATALKLKTLSHQHRDHHPFRALISRWLERRWALAALAAAMAILAFPNFQWSFLIPFCPFFLMLLIPRSRSGWDGLRWGYLSAYLMILGGGYWTAYVLHEYGPLPWIAAVPIFLLYAFIGALNFPLFMGLACLCYQNFDLETHSVRRELWYGLGFPALFTVVEFLVPKLFPWYLGHCLFNVPWMIQISEITGSIFLSFLVFCVGSTFALYVEDWLSDRDSDHRRLIAPAVLSLIVIGFGAYRLNESTPGSRLRVALIQGNIGSLLKVQSEAGVAGKIRKVLSTYEALTEKVLAQEPRPDLIVWPETAMPFWLDYDEGYFLQELRKKIVQWNVPLLTGGYSRGQKADLDRNSAYLFTPAPDGKTNEQVYHKNILLAFGEYIPGLSYFPMLYRYFPSVTHFERGQLTPKFVLDGHDLGITICYEAIVPSFFRRILANNVSAVINLTNDSWFGPTNEPLFHGSLTVFRAVENRIPLLRVANTGLSFSVDDRGRMSGMTELFERGIVQAEITLPSTPPRTIYSTFGDWFVVLAGSLFIILTASALNRRQKLKPREEKSSRRKVA